ncbi:MAG: O-methyltransferase [Alphaproteobacteria bacterium]|nr:O-methyltransferase [Alphaproteobacteria bacterium]
MTARKLTFADKLLPTCRANSDQYAGPPETYVEALYQMVVEASGIADPMAELDLETSERFTIEEMASNPVALRFLQMLIWMTGATHILEIGAFIGVSTIYLARALPPGGKVVSIEKFDEFAAICRANFARNGVADRIDLRIGDAFDIVPKLPRDELFGLVFIDGNKERYRDYVEMTEPLLAPGGVVVIDDVFFHGDAVNRPPRSEKGQGARAVAEAAARANNYRRLLLPLNNGMLLMMKERSPASPATARS